MVAVEGNPNRFKPLHYRSFLGDADPQDMRKQQELAALQAKIQADSPPPPPPAPVFTEAELESVRARAFEDGRAHGAREERQKLNQEAADRESALIQATNKLEEKLIGIGAEQAQFLAGQRDVLTQLAMTVAHKIAGRALTQNPLIEIEGMIGTALQQLGSKQPLNVYVHPAIVHYMESIYAEKAVHLPRDAMHISFHGDDALAQLDDCRVEWPNGIMSRTQADIWKQVETILQAFDPLAIVPTPAP